ncbi:MAG: FAD-binding protein, partial [Proteobacteria bacterium]|nr:FAD-binding protein [Pseudomonadota bacterium]
MNTYSKNLQFKNWAKSQQCRPERIIQPETEEEIISIVREAAASGKTIRVVGAGHSWSAIACTDHWMINLDKYNKVLKVDKSKKRVVVQAGMRLNDLNNYLADQGLALANLGHISEQSVAGAISTATHGTGIKYGNLSTQVVGIRLIKADCSVCDLDENDGEIWQAVRVSLGCLGIISEVTIQCVDAFFLEENTYTLPFEEAMDKMLDLVNSNDHVKFWWFPHVNYVYVFCQNRTDKQEKRISFFERWFENSFLAIFLFSSMLKTGMLFPKLIPGINRFIKVIHYKTRHRIERSDWVLNGPFPPVHNEAEYAVPAENAPEIIYKLREMIETRGMYVNFLVEARFIKADDCLLSPNYQRDSCNIGAYMAGKRGWSAYLAGFESIVASYQGRPHWGKE